jgi:hypothetical protein
MNNVSAFQHATFLDLSSTDVSDVTMLTSVRELLLNYCSISHWRFLHALHTLHIDFSSITDLSPLTHHEHLAYLSCCNTGISDLRPLATIPTLRTVLGSFCPRLTDANPLKHVAHIDLSDCIALTCIRDLNNASNIDLRGCTAVLSQDIMYLRETVPFVRWEDIELTETDEEMAFENDGDQH